MDVPHLRPCVSVIIDMSDKRALAPDVRTCHADEPYGLPDGWVRQFARMAEMGLDGEMLARIDHLGKQA